MAGDTYLKTEVLYAGGAVQQYIATNPISFAGADGASPPPSGTTECPPDTPPRYPEPQPDPPPPPCIDIPGYDKCVHIAPDFTGVFGETWISWNDGVVWERTYDHQPQDTYYHGEAREFVWNAMVYIGYDAITFKSGIVALMPGAFTPKYGNEYDELFGYYANYITTGSGLGNKQCYLNRDGTKGPDWGDPIVWAKRSAYTLAVEDMRLSASNQASKTTGKMYPPYSPEDYWCLQARMSCGDGWTLDHQVEIMYQWNGLMTIHAGYFSDVRPVETENWTTDPNYPLGASSITDFGHGLIVDSVAAPAWLSSATRCNEPWGLWCNCDRVGEPLYYGRGCPDREAPCHPEINGCQNREPPYYPERACNCEMIYTGYNLGQAERHTYYVCIGYPSYSVGVSAGMSAGDEFSIKYSSRQEGIWKSSASPIIAKNYMLMPCQPVARHYTNTRSLPDPASFDGMEEYTIDDVGVAHRWVWSHADQKSNGC